MKYVRTTCALIGLIATSGCATQMVQQQAKDMCAEEGKRPFVSEAKHDGIPLVIESASLRVHCVGPDDLVQMPSGFGADVINAPDLKGVGVFAVAPGSIAEKATLKAGDVIYEFGGQAVLHPIDLQTVIEHRTPGEGVLIKFRRNKRELTGIALFEAKAS